MDNRPSDDSPTPLDLSHCDEEPIHVPGAIQPIAVLLVLDEPALIIRQVSANVGDHFALGPDELLGQGLDRLFQSPILQEFQSAIQTENINNAPLHIATFRANHNHQAFDGIVHRREGRLILELEPLNHHNKNSPLDFNAFFKKFLLRIKHPLTVQQFCEILAEEVQVITGYDRVMIYRFAEDDTGEVIAETLSDGDRVSSYLGLRYPASDIPKQARQLYVTNWIRLIVDKNYQPVPLVPVLDPETAAPLDLSLALSRSVSPIHREYLENMGVTGTLTISIVQRNRLWGLIACHHLSPRHLSHEVRAACEFLGQLASMEITTLEEIEAQTYQVGFKSMQPRLLESMTQEKHFVDGLMNQSPNLMDYVNAQGVAIYFEGTLRSLGRVPDEPMIHQLTEWVGSVMEDHWFTTDCLGKLYPEAAAYTKVASGLMVFSLSKSRGNYVMWFRPEVVQTIHWAGDPKHPAEISNNGGGLKISPRKSFQLWQETVPGCSEPWRAAEIEAALELRNTLITLVLKRTEELSQLNQQLEKSNAELDAFAYIASHDLKEPLRGIHSYAYFLMEDYRDKLDEGGKAKLQTLVTLTQRMEDLIESLLYFSRVGRVDLSVKPTDLNAVVAEALDRLRISLSLADVEIRMPRPLPTVACDGFRVGEVFGNLISNAVKYNDKPQKWIEIGYRESPLPEELTTEVAKKGRQEIIFYVQDNGIGIPEKHQEAIFKIFKRLHARESYGGGAGAGLSIAKKIVERHGGRIWVASTPGEGSSFYFTLKEE